MSNVNGVEQAGAGDDEFGDSATEIIPAVRSDDDPPTAVQPPITETTGVPPLPRPAPPAARRVSPTPPRRVLPPPSRLGRAAMSGANLRAADGRDLRTILRNDRREVVGMALLVISALLIPIPLPYLAIFTVPVLVWAVGTLTVLACEGWIFKDRLAGSMAPIVSYVVGGVVLGAIKTPEAQGNGLTAFINSFWDVSGMMFMLGAAGGVAWLAYRLFNPPPPPPRRQPLGMLR
ncbi:hypothetical protein [Sphaerisporangium fuscum]|uniref:hypothetical protein n=1 Tax=Sphaerisporangium fuscum TaxID=2835868 RepID=UPI001BDD07D7|nr:hypothetical protein [Sphaerisporangium fuscum]